MRKDVNLPPLIIIPSKQLWYWQASFSFLIIVISACVIFPAAKIQIFWFLIWVLFSGSLLVGLWLQHQKLADPVIALRVYQGQIYYREFILSTRKNKFPVPEEISKKISKEMSKTISKDAPEILVDLTGEILVWSWVIILQLNSTDTNHPFTKKIIIVLRDSCHAEDWRRLSIYLLHEAVSND